MFDRTSKSPIWKEISSKVEEKDTYERFKNMKLNGPTEMNEKENK